MILPEIENLGFSFLAFRRFVFLTEIISKNKQKKVAFRTANPANTIFPMYTYTGKINIPL